MTTDDAIEMDRIDAFADLFITVEVRMGQNSMTLNELLAIDTGTLIALDKPAGEALDVLVGGIPFASAEVVVIEDQLAVRITALTSGGSVQRPDSLAGIEQAGD